MSAETEFNLKLSIKNKDIGDFKNLCLFSGSDFSTMNGKIVYINSKYPDKHIYTPYFMKNNTGYPLSYESPSSGYIVDREIPLFTLQDLSLEDYIVFYTSEDIKKIEEKKNQKP